MIPGDPLDRCWLRAEFAERNLFDRVLIALVAFDYEQRATLIGSGFVVAAFGKSALVVTATHNLEMAVGAQSSAMDAHPSALPEFAISRTKRLSIDRRKLRAIYRTKERVEACVIHYAAWVPELDVAFLAIAPQDLDSPFSFDHRVQIDTSIPRIGQEVVALAYDRMEVSNQIVDGKGYASASMASVPELRRGVITGIHLQGTRMHKWPCFETSIPISKGMSGGLFAWFSTSDQPMTAFGVASADISVEDAHRDFRVAGCSTGAMLWPALGLRLEATLQAPGTDIDGAETSLIKDFVDRGLVVDVNPNQKDILIDSGTDGRTTIAFRHGPIDGLVADSKR